MMRRCIAFKAGFVVVALSGCSQPGAGIPSRELNALEQGKKYELVSLDPDEQKRVDDASPDMFHKWLVLGRATIDDAETRKRLNDAFAAGAKVAGIAPAACFWPRHGIRVNFDGKAVDFVICFECSHVEVFADEKRTKQFLVSESPQPVFDDVLRARGIALSEKPK
jgi:hypothetical protein